MKEQREYRLVTSIMSPGVVSIPATASLLEAATRMETSRVSSVLVMDGDAVSGILTERDLLRALSSGLGFQESIRAVMTSHVISVSSQAEIHEALQTMVAHGIRHLMVVDSSGKVVGMLSESDFRKSRGVRGMLGLTPVSSVMTDRYSTFPRETPVESAARDMLDKRATCIVVVEDGHPVGIVTERDLVSQFSCQRSDSLLGEVMVSPVVTVRESAPSAEAASLMADQKVRKIVVTNDLGQTVGLVTEQDLVRQFEDDYVHMLRQLVVKQAKELNESKFYAVVNQLPQRVAVKDTASVFVACNANFAADLNLLPQQIVGKTDFDFFPQELAERYRADDQAVMSSRQSISVEEPYRSPTGEARWLQTSKAPIIDDEGHLKGLVCMYSDITERKHMIDELERRNWALRALSLSEKALVYAASESEMLMGVCQALVSEGKYLLAWIGWAQADGEYSVPIMAWAGMAQPYVQGLKVTWAAGPFGNGPTGRAIRMNQTQVENNAYISPSFKPWWERARIHGIQSVVAVPLRAGDRAIGAITIYSGDVGAFGPEEVKLFEELAENIVFGVQSRRTRSAYEKSLEDAALQAKRLEKALEDSLAGIAAVLEQRDPYTAGHQEHVAELAVKIGRELKLDEERIRILQLSGIVHDLGKVQIPAEILGKPARLNAAEFALIRQHPEAGYNILRKIDLPWPIAEIIRQHHEYLDGSGYPRGLKDEDIAYESRIITVADIVESMSSDRPYRPALGIPEAIKEISRMRGTKLDSAVVDACIKVLSRGEFSPHILSLGEDEVVVSAQ